MSDRFHSLTVTLERDMKDEDAEPLIQAIMQLRQVASVTPHVSNIESHMAEQRARARLGEEILKVVFPPKLPL